MLFLSGDTKLLGTTARACEEGRNTKRRRPHGGWIDCHPVFWKYDPDENVDFFLVVVISPF